MNWSNVRHLKFFDFKQRKREVYLAFKLIKSLDGYSVNYFKWLNDHIKNAETLTANPMGKMLLGRVASIYIE